MTAFRQTLRTAADLADAGLISRTRAAAIEAVAERYAVAVTPATAALIDASDPTDPIARQFIPDPRELDRREEERDDPIGDRLKSPLAGLVHRYRDRVLLKLVSACPVYCRFCFRREMVGPGKSPTLSDEQLGAALDYIRDHPEIWEVILTGGDPLILSPRRVAEVTVALGRHRARKSAALAHARSGRRTRARHGGACRQLALAETGGVRGAARKPPARDDGRSTHSLCPPRRQWDRDGEPDRALARHQR